MTSPIGGSARAAANSGAGLSSTVSRPECRAGVQKQALAGQVKSLRSAHIPSTDTHLMRSAKACSSTMLTPADCAEHVSTRFRQTSLNASESSEVANSANSGEMNSVACPGGRLATSLVISTSYRLGPVRRRQWARSPFSGIVQTNGDAVCRVPPRAAYMLLLDRYLIRVIAGAAGWCSPRGQPIALASVRKPEATGGPIPTGQAVFISAGGRFPSAARASSSSRRSSIARPSAFRSTSLARACWNMLSRCFSSSST